MITSSSLRPLSSSRRRSKLTAGDRGEQDLCDPNRAEEHLIGNLRCPIDDHVDEGGLVTTRDDEALEVPALAQNAGVRADGRSSFDQGLDPASNLDVRSGEEIQILRFAVPKVEASEGRASREEEPRSSLEECGQNVLLKLRQPQFR